MSEPVTPRRDLSHRSNAGIGRMLVLSFILHVLLFALMGGYLVPRFEKPQKPVYYVDLLNKPVAKPRAGRPDAPAKKKAPKKKKPVIKKAPAVTKPPVKKKPVTVKKAPAEVVKTQPKATQKTPVVKQPADVPTKTVEKNYQEETLDAIERLKRKQRINALKQELNALATRDIPTTDTIDAPVGEVGGQGDEVGVGFDSWIKEYLSQAWALPRHYWERGLKAKMVLQFNTSGRLAHYEMLSPSGDSFFDASVKRAVQQLTQLPSKPARPLELIVTFDPKEMLMR
ncbi:TonB C-terminal domain-containing protein [Desulfuromonas acetoxidans]|uniref:TonB-like n=1 Tax=Desulfuromonas acetoxidans (strain DSM 684 / 11070) TaxID=281689 RepID=Q1JZH9_DESA6|nr:TonB C-terminal domain-containing protein [Desulfuromonas acetoxidans]EAT15588.1 TonB-like [Desulfuromonas acetoxidans DSM 684]MBF0645785.1 TonB C-terminal domain-containing protein [Desulfuromonas acetoxidans]NVD25181.1 TonB C-terminal domain-containing protein [Desulfuromonas acetoxidans]NVE17197.1 TonB C-terminal domain-containing protein [Desulfuromonas acetoxidans]